MQPHELIREFKKHHFALNKTLEEMLNEHHSHQTERRGCGYTQATRHLAEYINRPRVSDASDDLRLFRHWQSLKAIHNRSQRAKPIFDLLYRDSNGLQTRLQRLPESVGQEESRLLAQMIVDIVLPVSRADKEVVVLPSYPEKLAIGSCPLAEKYFLELAHKHVKRHGLMNIIVDDSGRPVIIEKINLGDNHSCLSLVELVMNGVRLPPGSLFGVDYDEQILQQTERKFIPGQQIRLADCRGFRFLRLTTLAVTPANRARAFTTHFEAQQMNGLFAPESTRLDQLYQIARSELNYANGQ